jgi:hypothetical protein
MNQHRLLRAFALVVLVVATAGCWIVPMTPGGPEQTTAAYRFQYEMINNAQRVRIETQPVWQGGRYAYRDGVDEILLINRITAWADNVTDEQRKSGDYQRTDRIIERLWITTTDMEVGTWYNLYDMNKELKVGYDEKPTELDEFFIRAFGVEGKIMLQEKNGDDRVFRLSMRLSPKERTDWTLTETLTLKVQPDGVLAKRAPDDAPVSAPRIRNKAEEELKAQLPTATPVNADGTPAQAPDATAPNQAATQTTPEPEKPAANSDRERIVGQWQGDTGVYEMKLQFKEDGNFVYSSSRSGFSPGMKYGKWEIRGNLLVMHVQRFEFDGRDHMRFMRDPYIILQIRWLADKLSLYGDFKDREGAQGNMRVDFDKGEFADMEQTVPPPRP